MTFRTIENFRLVDGEKIDNLPDDTNTELEWKVDKVTWKGLSTNDYNNTEKAKVDNAVQDVIAWQNTTVNRNWNVITVNSLWWPAVVTDWFNRNYFVATEWETEFTATFDFTENTWSVIVALNWQVLKPTLDYTEPWSNQIVFINPLTEGDEVQLLTGIKWEQGEQGIQGMQWEQWEKWDKWDTWDKWEKWDTWEKWDKWEKWDTGEQGIQGIQWEKWDKWDTGNWISTIVRTSWDWSPWTTDTYTITFTDTTTTTFQVYNWANWVWTVASVSSWTHITVDNTDPNNPIINYNWELFSTGLKDKLDWIEAGATADQTAEEIKTAYESNLNTNAYTDNEKTKLSWIEEEANNYILPADVVQDSTYVKTDENYTTAEKDKLAWIEPNATADQTAWEIKTAYESNADTNAYTDAEKTKLTNIEAGAEVNTINSWDNISLLVNDEWYISNVVTDVIVATEWQTAFTVPTYTTNRIQLKLNWLDLIKGDDYTETNSTTITLTSWATAWDKLKYLIFN